MALPSENMQYSTLNEHPKPTHRTFVPIDTSTTIRRNDDDNGWWVVLIISTVTALVIVGVVILKCKLNS